MNGKHVYRSFSLLAVRKLFLVWLFVAGLISQAFGQGAHFDGTSMFIPAIQTGNAVYAAELTISSSPNKNGFYPVVESNPVMLMFDLVSFELTGESPVSPAFLDPETGQLVIPHLDVNGNSFWVVFSIWYTDPIRFELVDFGLDDLDDDDDGIPDAEDSSPYSASDSHDPLVISGSWLFGLELTGDLKGCVWLPEVTQLEVEIAYDSDWETYRLNLGFLITSLDPVSEVNGRVLGYSFSFQQGEGITEAAFTLLVESRQYLTGMLNLTWDGGGWGSCEDVQWKVAAVKQ